ncbi:flagellar hook assembly protein FlgD [Polymorphobacter fuscus]|uniref:Basal-body rod modification protein FlgD n=1 Tax=Sandarakinorhabdus fusca TaxID=1439888 RepID=A0A7C9GM59_9SPHN|nr:flagellar hook capping FlgD N-terminal domain-containing protein [Polymorphobacter fuscus]KAB7648231.1 flagellar hook capping protein [Polymorphobacter fuscus]MQT15737.1 flagellar hook capping protein [Polymorphobacter fuscus]NJC07992.1 flagellar basal-body rod modification protein FlgD [Polymorphobacter fuscus]
MSVTAIPGVRTVETGVPKPPKKTLDQSDFLALMGAQLKNQDPTKPVDNTEYVAQMAQFSTVSGIAETNRSLTAIVERLDRLVAATPSAPSAQGPAA